MLIQLGGIGVFINEAAIRPTARESVLAICALAIMGSEAAKELVLRLLDRVLSGGS